MNTWSKSQLLDLLIFTTQVCFDTMCDDITLTVSVLNDNDNRMALVRKGWPCLLSMVYYIHQALSHFPHITQRKSSNPRSHSGSSYKIHWFILALNESLHTLFFLQSATQLLYMYDLWFNTKNKHVKADKLSCIKLSKFPLASEFLNHSSGKIWEQCQMSNCGSNGAKKKVIRITLSSFVEGRSKLNKH